MKIIKWKRDQGSIPERSKDRKRGRNYENEGKRKEGDIRRSKIRLPRSSRKRDNQRQKSSFQEKEKT